MSNHHLNSNSDKCFSKSIYCEINKWFAQGMKENCRWARRELNSRSSPCQGDVIAPRPRALANFPNGFGIYPNRSGFQDTILEILPVHPSSEQNPAHLVRPLLILTSFESLIGPYVLHFKQNPLTSAMGTKLTT